MIKQPSGIKEMTNVAIIRYRMNNKHFEIACYKNKAINWRNGQEKNIDEVLQIDKIFTSASHGQVASNSELENFFGPISKKDIIKVILDKGELQLGEKERDVQLESIYKGIVKFIQEKCVHSKHKLPFNQSSIEHAIGKTTFIVKSDQTMKKQALACIKILQEQFQIQRAEMRVSISVREEDKEKLLAMLVTLNVPQEGLILDSSSTVVAVMDPSIFRPLSQVLKDDFPKSAIEVIDANIVNREIESIEQSQVVELELRKDKEVVEKIEEKKYEKEEKHERVEKKVKSKKKIQQQQLKKKEEQHPTHKVEEESKSDVPTDDLDKPFKCSMCRGAAYDQNVEFRQHYKSEWHNFNLKLKTKGLATFSNEQYLEKILDEQMND